MKESEQKHVFTIFHLAIRNFAVHVFKYASLLLFFIFC
jgi:hypothetical protein